MKNETSFKKILVPTDFSAIAENAVDYAAEIAKAAHAEIILLHVYQVPFVAPEVTSMIPSINSIEETCVQELVKLRSRIHLQHGPHIKVRYAYTSGYAVEEINRYANENRPDLIVMGMHGAGYLAKKLIGSVTTALIERSSSPVLAINQGIRFTGLKKIVLAYDYLPLESSNMLNPIKAFTNLFGSHIYVLNVVRESELIPNVQQAVAGVRLEHLLERTNHSFHFVEGNDVMKRIDDFVSERHIDLLVMFPHQHNFFQQLFRETHTSKATYGAKVPVLSIPGVI